MGSTEPSLCWEWKAECRRHCASIRYSASLWAAWSRCLSANVQWCCFVFVFFSCCVVLLGIHVPTICVSRCFKFSQILLVSIAKEDQFREEMLCRRPNLGTAIQAPNEISRSRSQTLLCPGVPRHELRTALATSFALRGARRWPQQARGRGSPQHGARQSARGSAGAALCPARRHRRPSPVGRPHAKNRALLLLTWWCLLLKWAARGLGKDRRKKLE